MAPTISTIACYRTHQEYSVNFFGAEITVTQTETPSVIRRWINSVLFKHRRFRHSRRLVVGVGVQWTVYTNGSGPADTLQLCVGNRCIIIQLTHCPRIPRILRRFLTDSDTTFVGVWNGQDARKLEECKHRLEICEILDLREYVKDSEGDSMMRCSFEKIVEECLGYEGVCLDKRISLSNWSVGFLDLDQIRQATVDAYVCFDLGVGYRLWGV